MMLAAETVRYVEHKVVTQLAAVFRTDVIRVTIGYDNGHSRNSQTSARHIDRSQEGGTQRARTRIE
jgi:hypothetical protein